MTNKTAELCSSCHTRESFMYLLIFVDSLPIWHLGGTVRSSSLLMVCCALFRGLAGWDLFWKVQSVFTWRRIITKHAADSRGTKAALTSSLLVASRGWSRSLLTLLTQTLFSSLLRGRTTCSITRCETDFFQLQWTGHKPRLTTSSAQREQREDGWAGSEDKREVGAAQGALNKVVIHFNRTF